MSFSNYLNVIRTVINKIITLSNQLLVSLMSNNIFKSIICFLILFIVIEFFENITGFIRFTFNKNRKGSNELQDDEKKLSVKKQKSKKRKR